MKLTIIILGRDDLIGVCVCVHLTKLVSTKKEMGNATFNLIGVRVHFTTCLKKN